MRSGTKVAIAGGVFAVVAGGVGYGAVNVWNGITGGRQTSTSETGAERRSGPVTGEEVDATAKGFLAAWAEGDPVKAAQFTNDPAGAQSALAGHATETHVTGLKATAGTPTGATVPFTVSAVVSYDGVRVPWTYESELKVVRGLTTGQPRVDWKPAVMHPALKNGESLKVTSSGAPQIKAVDRDGEELTAEAYPSLGPVIDQLRKRYGAEAGGTPGVELVASAEGDGADRTLLTLREGKAGTVRTTLDADMQAAAEKQVKKYAGSSVVALQPSTGEIRAVANNRTDGYNAAFMGTQAPGSTLKIVTAAMLMERGEVSATSPAQCTPEASWYGRAFTNDDGFSLKESDTFTTAFARSCNTAFIKRIDEVDDHTALPATARDVFGIGLTWNVGVPTHDGTIPAEDGVETAAQYIGQGKVQMNVLNIASVTATAKTNTFKQPVIVPLSLDDREPARAARGLSPSVGKQLRDMMRATASYGTGAQAMATVRGDKGAKTGSAEVDSQSTPNSWFTAFADDMAAAAVVQAGGHGSDAAGPLVAAVLNAR
ncbi:penicillin-binding transpeptidase domain-containing protein [Streptomyces sp. CC77]|uniref:penicillin-binding transpeptidase domain-containing protein n=1 Tax=Streptomyces sp. CC77 TaxID=1906739 RepID=UPI0008DD9571|nr:penicillin-binding transpeptidase domain-containing protein [Streptomyces sp. CC77]OII68033.1 penicillin-binding protein [Streptomyces sp. CC77]